MKKYFIKKTIKNTGFFSSEPFPYHFMKWKYNSQEQGVLSKGHVLMEPKPAQFGLVCFVLV